MDSKRRTVGAPRPPSARHGSRPSSAASLRTAVLESVPMDDLGASTARLTKIWEKESGEWLEMDLHTACACGDYAYVRELLEGGADANRLNVAGWTPLVYASFLGHDTVVNLLLETGDADGNARTSDGMTALMWASACNHESIAYFLLQNGVDIEAKDAKSRTSVMLAAQNGQTAALKILIDSKANIESTDPATGRSPLLLAVQNRHELAVQTLIDAGADFKKVDKSGDSALSLAKKKPCSMVILNLLENAERGKGTTRGGASLRLDAANLRSEAGLPILSAFEVPGGGRSMRNSASQLPYLPSPTKTRARGDSEEPQQPDIHEFLEVLGLTKYLPLFEKEEVDFETLVTMTETDLKGIGLSLFGPRRKISSAIKCWQEEQQAEDDQEVDLLVSELQCSFEARVSEEMKMLTDKVNDLSTSLTESQAHRMKLEEELAAGQLQ